MRPTDNPEDIGKVDQDALLRIMVREARQEYEAIAPMGGAITLKAEIHPSGSHGWVDLPKMATLHRHLTTRKILDLLDRASRAEAEVKKHD